MEKRERKFQEVEKLKERFRKLPTANLRARLNSLAEHAVHRHESGIALREVLEERGAAGEQNEG